MVCLDDILDELVKNHPTADLELVRRAYAYGTRAHRGQTRKNGEPYIMHPLEVAQIVARLHLDPASVCAGFLHDTVEDTEVTVEEVALHFGEDIAQLVESLTKLNKINFQNQEEAQAANFRKMLLAMSKDLRVILIKLSDRLHNMRTLGNLREEKQRRIAQETLDIYAPLASRLGLYWLKVEMEDLCFKYLNRDAYKEIAALVQKTRSEREQYIESVVDELSGRFEAQRLNVEVTGRPKHLWSIHQKLNRAGRDFDKLYDILAFRVLVDSLPSCYEALGVVHSLWRPIPGRFKDYIALPKQNGYQSLHTAVFGPEGERIEVQIRTKEMHQLAELGVAAHWAYKEGKSAQGRLAPDQTFSWLRQLLEWQQDLKDPKDFMETVKVDLFDEEVYVFTPQGEVKPMPRGATPIDFAYSIHTELGHECVGSRVNGVQVSLRYELQNGDVVEIARNAGGRPKVDWLQFVKTGKAANKIRTFIRQEETQQALTLGEELLERGLRSFGYSLSRFRREGLLESLIEFRRRGSERELYLDFGYLRADPKDPLELFFKSQEDQSLLPEALPERVPTAPPPDLSREGDACVLVDGEDGIMVHFPDCCSPVHGDEVFGFVTIGRGVTVHRRDCPRCLDYDPARRIAVSWNQERKQQRHVTLKVYSDNTPGLLASMSQAFHRAGVNISAVNCQTTEEMKAVNEFTVLITDLDQLNQVSSVLKNISGVTGIQRVSH